MCTGTCENLRAKLQERRRDMQRLVGGLGMGLLTLLLAHSAWAEERVVHFSQVNALTGQAGSYGTRSVHGVELAAKHLNEAGGFADTCGNTYTIKLSVWDMANSREQAIAGLRKAADDRTVLAVLGPTPSTGFAAMEPVAGQVKTPMIGTGAAVPIKKWNPYAFRVTIATPVAAPHLLKVFKEKFNPKRVALLYDITQDALRAEAELIRELAPKIGFALVAFEAFRVNDTDFRAQLTTIKGANPEWLGVYAANPEGSKIVNQMDELELLSKIHIFSGYGVFQDPTYWDLSNGKIQGAINWAVAFDLASPDPQMQKVVTDYRSFPEEPTIYSVYGYQALQAAVDAVKRSCTATDREKFRDALGQTQLDALAGSVVFNSPPTAPNGENQGGSVIISRVTGRDSYEVIK
jgi:branched-chain amino acid transport system substrate-binding protein